MRTFLARLRWLTVLLALALLGVGARARASMIVASNQTPATATSLSPGVLSVSGNLAPLMPATILGEFDPAYASLLADGPAAGGAATEWDDVPLRFNGSQYFRVTGAGDTNFDGNHTQSGKFTYQFKVFSPSHVLLQTTTATASINAGTVKNIWVNPASAAVGGTVDVTVSDLSGPGDVDFYTFSGLQPGQAFTANISATGFSPRLGLWANSRTRQLVTNAPSFSGVADGSGKVLIGVTAAGDTNFTGSQNASGTYTLTVVPKVVPEPASVVLLGIGGLLGALVASHRKKQASAR